jgi:HJR/Mrr/RecB family endonuclease
MQFKDAAYEILKEAGKPLHYSEITDLAQQKGILDTTGQTPHATMGALLYTDTLKENSRFRRGDEKGTFALAVPGPKGIKQQIESIQKQIRQDLRKHLLKMHPQKFEELIRSLLEEMGFDEAETTAYRNDRGVDVRGILKTNPLSTTRVAIQAKRWTANVGAGVVRDLRGSLRVADNEQGLIITPSDFTAEARNESTSEGRTPIALINGNQLVELLIQYQVGVRQEQYMVPSIDAEYWSEVLGVSVQQPGISRKQQDALEKAKNRASEITISAALETIKRKFQQNDLPVRIPLQKGKSFEAIMLEGGISVDNLGGQPVLPWRVFEEAMSILKRKAGQSEKGDAMNCKLGDKGLSLDSIEGHIAHVVYGKQVGETVFRRITPISAILVWAGLCTSDSGTLILR